MIKPYIKNLFFWSCIFLFNFFVAFIAFPWLWSTSLFPLWLIMIASVGFVAMAIISLYETLLILFRTNHVKSS